VTFRPTRRGPARTRLVLVAGSALCLLALSGLLAPAAQAHASLVSTDPVEGAVLAEAPTSVTLTFNEPVTVGSGVQLYAADGAVVSAEARSVVQVVTVTPMETLDRGTFVLTYRVVSTDGHPVTGSLSFSVGAPSDTVLTPSDVTVDRSSATTALHRIVQGTTYLALLLAAGLAVFLALLLPDAAVLSEVRRRLLRLLRLAATVAVSGALALVPLGAVYQQGTGLAGLGTAATWTHFESVDGLVALVVLAGLGVVVGVLGSGAPDRVERVLVPGAAGAAVASVALAGHTRAYGPTWLVVGSDILHVVAAAVWFGGLVGLALTLPALAKRERLVASTLARFSVLAGGLLAAVAVAGVLLGWRILGSWSGLAGTTYGLVLLTKTGLVGLVAAVAGWNRYRLLPAVLDDLGYRRRVHAAVRVRRAVRLEALGLVAVLLLTGFLVDQVPRGPEQSTATAGEPRTVAAVGDDVRVVAHLAPGTVGPNTVTVQVQDLGGEPLEPYATPEVSVGTGGLDLGSRPAVNVDSGTYRSEVIIPRPGRWRIRVSVRLDAFTNPVLTVETDVREG
jgi:copper transport protein